MLMNNTEYHRLRAFAYANKHRFRPSVTVTSRRSAKSMATATGQVIKSSKIVHEVGIEKVFKKYP